MRHVHLVTALSLIVVAALSGCNGGASVTPAPIPTSPATPQLSIGTGGPCGDGTVLRPNEHCP